MFWYCLLTLLLVFELGTNLEAKVLVLCHLSNLFQKVLETLLSGVRYIRHHVNAQLGHPKLLP